MLFNIWACSVRSPSCSKMRSAVSPCCSASGPPDHTSTSVQYRVRLGLRFQLMGRLCFGEASLRPSAGIRVATLVDPAATRSGLANWHERRPPRDLSRR